MSRVFAICELDRSDISPAGKHGEIVRMFKPRELPAVDLKVSLKKLSKRFAELKFDPKVDRFLLAGGTTAIAMACIALSELHENIDFVVYVGGDYILRNVNIGELG